MDAFGKISEKDFHRFANVIEIKQFEKGQVILKKGQVCMHAYFILSGCMRKFEPEKDKEVSLGFYFENDIASDFFSMRYEVPSKFSIETMEDCRVCCIAKADSASIIQDSKSLNEIMFRFFQDLYFKEEEHCNCFKLMSLEERYQFLLKQKPQYFQRIPLIYLASYLGMSRETLTRIRKKMKQQFCVI